MKNLWHKLFMAIFYGSLGVAPVSLLVTAFFVAHGMYFEQLSGPSPWERMGAVIVLIPLGASLTLATALLSVLLGWQAGLTRKSLWTVGAIMGFSGLFPLIPAKSLADALVVFGALGFLLVAIGLLLLCLNAKRINREEILGAQKTAR